MAMESSRGHIEKMEEMHRRWVAQMIKSAEGRAGLLHKISKPTAWREGAQILIHEEEDARLLGRCGKNGQNTGSVMRRCRTWRKSLERMRN